MDRINIFGVADADSEESTYHKNLQKEEILNRLQKKGCRITKQREALIDVILESECTCCKEIYYFASKKLPNIGMATIYRMIGVLEEIGAIKKENPYRISHTGEAEVQTCIVKLENNIIVELSDEKLRGVIERGLESCGYLEGNRVQSVLVK